MTLLHSDVGHQNVIVSVVFSPDGSRILSGGWEGTAKIWDVQTGRSLALASWGSLAIIELTDWRRVAQFHIKQADLRNAVYSEDSKQIACIDSGGVVVFNAVTAQPSFVATDEALFHDVERPDDSIPIVRLPNPRARIDPEDNAGHLLRFWTQLLPCFGPATASDSGMEIQRIAFCPTGNLAAVHQTGDFSMKTMRPVPGGITFLDTTTGQIRLFLESPEQKWLRTIAFSPDGKLIVASGDHQETLVWSVETGQDLNRIGQPPPRITSLAWSPSTSVERRRTPRVRPCFRFTGKHGAGLD